MQHKLTEESIETTSVQRINSNNLTVVMNGTISLAQQLIDAIEEENLENLRALLSQEQHQDGRVAVVMDGNVDEALHAAAQTGPVEACRLLVESLSESGKEKHKAAENCSIFYCPLHTTVVLHGNLPAIHLFTECDFFNLNQKDDCNNTPL